MIGSTAFPARLFWGVIGKARLTGPRRAPLRSGCTETFAEQVVKVIGSFNGSDKEILIWRGTVASVLTNTKEHFCQGPACPQNSIRVVLQNAPLLHQSVTDGHVKIKGAFSELFGEVSVILSTVETVQRKSSDGEYVTKGYKCLLVV